MARTKPTQRRAAPRCGCEAWEDPLAPPGRVLCPSQVAHLQRVAGESLSPEDERALPSAIRTVHAMVEQLCSASDLVCHEDSALAVVLRAATHHMRLTAAASEAAAAAASSSSAAAAAAPAVIPPLLPVSTATERHAARLPQLEADAATGCGHALFRLDRYRAEPPPLSADQLHQQSLVSGLDEMTDERTLIDFEWQLYPDPLAVGSSHTPRLQLAQTAFSALLGRSPLPSDSSPTPIGHVFQAARHMAARAGQRREEEEPQPKKRRRQQQASSAADLSAPPAPACS